MATLLLLTYYRWVCSPHAAHSHSHSLGRVGLPRIDSPAVKPCLAKLRTFTPGENFFL